MITKLAAKLAVDWARIETWCEMSSGKAICEPVLERVKQAGLELEEDLERTLTIAEHLWQMVPQDVWREHGAEWMGQYEGDYHAEQVREELMKIRNDR